MTERAGATATVMVICCQQATVSRALSTLFCPVTGIIERIMQITYRSVQRYRSTKEGTMLDFATIFMLVRVAIGLFLLWLLYRLVRSGIARVRGDQEGAKRLRGQLIGFIIALVLLWPATGLRLEQRYLERYYRPQLYEIAETLDYTDEDFLVEGFTCVDPLLTFYPLTTESCRISLYFTTDLAVDDLKQIVMHFPAERIFDSKGESFVSNRFSAIGVRTSFLQTITKGKATTEDDSPTRLHSHSWRVYQNDEIVLRVELFEISETMKFMLDDNPIKSNLIRVDVELGRVHLY
jgi:hypothetical protein